MMMETLATCKPEIVVASLEYRATNPLVINIPITIHGAVDKTKVHMWAEDARGTVGMKGVVRTGEGPSFSVSSTSFIRPIHSWLFANIGPTGAVTLPT